MGKKPIFVILALILMMSISFVVVAAPALEDLKKVFVTRQEVLDFETSITGFFASVENAKQVSIQNEVGYQMYRRGLRLPTEEGSTIDPSLMSSWSERRSRELETMPSSIAPPSPTVDGTNWMSKIPGDRYLSEINMPGTHDSGMVFASSGNTLVDMGKVFAITQNKTITEQLNMGVRFFDIRVDDSNDLYVCHGSGSTKFFAFKETDCTNKIKLSDVIYDMELWLSTHDSETIVMCINCEDGNKATCATKINTLITGDTNIEKATTFKTLASVKGKIVLVTRISGQASVTGGLDFTGITDNAASTKVVDGVTFEIEDKYNCSIATKKSQIDTVLGKCATTTIDTSATKTTKSALIFTSAYEGMTTNPQAMANDINPYVKSKTLTKDKAYGWVLFNFIDADLCKKIWQTNPEF